MCAAACSPQVSVATRPSEAPSSAANLGASTIIAPDTAPRRREDWSQWHGPQRDGHVPASYAIPESLENTTIVWHKPIGDGVASPMLSGGVVFYLDNQGDKETLHAASAADGKELWQQSFDDIMQDGMTRPGPRCAPLVDGERVYAQSSRGKLQCRAVADGKLLWQSVYAKDFGSLFFGNKGKAMGASRHGYASSPMVDGDHLIAEPGGPNGAGIVCFDKTTGKVIWKSQNAMAAYAAPIMVQLAGTRQIVAFMADAVIAVSPADGRLLWRVPVKTAAGRHVTTPVVFNDIVIVASHQAGLIGIQVSKSSDGLDARQIWTAKESAMNVSSPVIVEGFLYGLGPEKNLICVDPQTGAQTWSEERYFSATSAEQTHAGMLVMGNTIAVLTDRGQLALVAADPKKFRQISQAQVCGVNWCEPAYADGKMYLRDANELKCVRLLK